MSHETEGFTGNVSCLFEFLVCQASWQCHAKTGAAKYLLMLVWSSLEMSSGFWKTTLTQSTSSKEDLWTVIHKTEIFWDIHDIMCFSSARCCTWWMDLQSSPLNTISHMTVYIQMYGQSQGHPICSSGSERQKWTLSFVVCLTFLTRMADYIHPLPREMKERRWTVVYRGGFLLYSTLSSSCFTHFFHSYCIAYAKGLLSSDLTYSVNTTKHKPALVIVFDCGFHLPSISCIEIQHFINRLTQEHAHTVDINGLLFYQC